MNQVDKRRRPMFLRAMGTLSLLAVAAAGSSCSQGTSLSDVLARIHHDRGDMLDSKSYGNLNNAVQSEDQVVEGEGIIRSTGDVVMPAPSHIRQRVLLTVQIPRDAQIMSTRAFMKNNFGPENCDLLFFDFVEVPIDGGEAMIEKCEVKNLNVEVIGNEQEISVEFWSWSGCNRRSGKLEVDWVPTEPAVPALPIAQENEIVDQFG